MSLSKLPSEVLSLVLNNRAMSLRHRLRLRLLSARCCAVLEDGLKKKRALVIRHEEAKCPYPKPNDLVIKSDVLTEELIHLLARLFPEPNELTLSFGWGDKPYHMAYAFWENVHSLLVHFATNLSTVKLYGGFAHIRCPPIAKALAALPNLTSLTLCGSSLIIMAPPYIGAVLSRLEKFACPATLSYKTSFFEPSLSTGCTHLLLDHDVFSSFSAPFLAQLTPSLIHLHLVNCFHGGQTNWKSLSQMHTLTSLTIHYTLLVRLCIFISFLTDPSSFLLNRLISTRPCFALFLPLPVSLRLNCSVSISVFYACLRQMSPLCQVFSALL